MDISTKIQLTSFIGLVCFWLLIAGRPDLNVNKNFKYAVFTVSGFCLSIFVLIIAMLWQV